MTRQAELVGIIQPEVDDRALDQEAQQMESRLNDAAKLSPSIDSRKIKRELERAIPGGGILGNVADSFRGGGRSSTGGAGGDSVPGAGATLQTAQLEKLKDIHDELEKIGQSGGITGGGGDEGGGRFSAGSVLKKTVLAGGLGASGTGLALSPGIFGKGSKFKPDKQKTGPIFGALTGTSGQTKNEAFRTIRKRRTGSEEPPLKQYLGSENRSGVEKAIFNEVYGDEKSQSKQSKKGGKTSPPEFNKPEWLTDLTNPEITEPGWLSDFTDPQITAPDWLSKLPGVDDGPLGGSNNSSNGKPKNSNSSGNGFFGLGLGTGPLFGSESDTPERSTRGGRNQRGTQPTDSNDEPQKLNINVNPSSPIKVGINSGKLEKQIEKGFDQFRDQVVQDAVKEIEKQISGGF